MRPGEARKRVLAGAAALAICAACCLPVRAAEGQPPFYMKSATYVSDGWAANFWNTESDHMEEELSQIRRDGFNSVILVVPWREFQPTTVPVSYSEYPFEKLNQVMEAANRHGLGVVLRVGYTWDYCGDDSSSLRFRELIRDSKVREAWISYIERVYQAACGHDNFWGGFITWEDLWNYVEDASGLGRGQYSRTEAGKIGYQSYLKSHYSLGELKRIYGDDSFKSYEQVYIPARSSYAYHLFYEFYDNWLNNLLQASQRVFPGLSMEVRLDSDSVESQEGGEALWISHESTYPCQSAAYTCAMYSVAMKQAEGAQLTAAQAAEGLRAQLQEVREENGGKPIFLDQLLYMDETEGFDANARLAPAERGGFLTSISGLLSSYTNGYGIWTYRNYSNNPVYNSQFALGSRGWEVEGGAVEERGGSHMMKLLSGGSISQKIGHRIGGRSTHDTYVRFLADSDEPAVVTVTLGKTQKQVTVDGKRDFELSLGKINYYEVEFSSEGNVYLDNIQVYNFVQDGQLYDMDGRELSCAGALRALNGSMP